MGYRSDVVIAHSFISKSHMEEVLTVLTLDKRFAEYKLADHVYTSEEYIPHEDKYMFNLVVVGEQWKWYEESQFGGYEDVACINSLLTICQDFNTERGVPYAYKFLRICEDVNDEEMREKASDCQHGEWLGEMQERVMFINRTIEKDFANLQSVSRSLTEKENDNE